jgi:hypothetical protein
MLYLFAVAHEPREKSQQSRLKSGCRQNWPPQIKFNQTKSVLSPNT